MQPRRLLIFGGLLMVGIVAGYLFSSSGRTPNTGAPVVVEDMIMLDAPLSGGTVSSPLTVTGRARGNWYFEASFPVILKGPGGVTLATVPAQAQGDWMTTDWVPFSATLTFTPPPSGSMGTLILQKDNPSGEPQYDDSRSIPVQF